MESKILIKYKNVDIYQQDELVLKNVQIDIRSGQFIFFLGKVGSGKTSLMKSFYGEASVCEGFAEVLEHDLNTIKTNDVPFLRRKIGIVFQDFQLLTDRSVYQNLEFVLRATGWKDIDVIDEQIEGVLKQVGMADKSHKMPHQLSGGEQQRIVIARALLNSPEIIIADEPTGNLDLETGREIVDLLYNITKSGTTVIMATHNLNWLDLYQGRIFRFESKKVKELQNISTIESVTVKEIVENDKVVEIREIEDSGN
ncbi:MAG: ATP-binding cassette domain-containing protein [Paludibacter sp.]|nr:ATP-binding cassette domain-containing protein [Paludibacter sp.]